MKFDIAKELRMVTSQKAKSGWVIVSRGDRDWDSGKPLNPKKLRQLTAEYIEKLKMGIKW